VSGDTETGLLSVHLLASTLRTLGLTSGDTVMVHSDLRRFGVVRNMRGRLSLALEPKVLYQALRDVIGPHGTIVVPAFSYSWTRGLLYSVERSPSLEGSFSEYVRTLPGTRRSLHPLMSVAAIGPAAEALLAGPDTTSFGSDSPFARLHRVDAKQLTVGVSVSSFSDYVQWACRVPYRYRKRFRGWIETGEQLREAECEHCVRYLDQGLETRPVFEVLEDRRSDLIRTGNCHGVLLRLVQSRDLFNFIAARLEADPYAFTTRPRDERAVTWLGQVFRNPNKMAPCILALDREGQEQWLWLFPAGLFRFGVSIEGPAGEMILNSDCEKVEAALHQTVSLPFLKTLTGADIKKHLVADRKDLTLSCLLGSGWLLRPLVGKPLRLVPSKRYRVRLELGIGSDQADNPEGSCRLAILPRISVSGADFGIQAAADWLSTAAPADVKDFAAFALQRLLGKAQIVALLLDEDDGPTDIPLFRPDLVAGQSARRTRIDVFERKANGLRSGNCA